MKAKSEYDGWSVFKRIALMYARQNLEDMKNAVEILKTVKLNTKDESKTTQEN